MKLFIFAILTAIAIALGLLSIADASDIKLAKVDLKGFGEYQDSVATYGYQKCLQMIGKVEGKYSCENMILTFNGENGGRNKDLQSNCYKTEKGACESKGTWRQREMSFGFCQIHVRNSDYKSMLVFGKKWSEITREDVEQKRFTKEFADPYGQMDICVGMRKMAMENGNMPWYAFNARYARGKKVKFINPPLSDNITQPAPAKTPKPTGVRCKIIHTVQPDETLKITNKRGVITKWLKDLWVGDTIAVCK